MLSEILTKNIFVREWYHKLHWIPINMQFSVAKPSIPRWRASWRHHWDINNSESALPQQRPSSPEHTPTFLHLITYIQLSPGSSCNWRVTSPTRRLCGLFQIGLIGPDHFISVASSTEALSTKNIIRVKPFRKIIGWHANGSTCPACRAMPLLKWIWPICMRMAME